MRKLSIVAVAASALTLFATVGRSADAKENWAKNCKACHGPDGAGKTKAGRMAGVKDLTDAAYQKTFTDDQAAKQIAGGFKNAAGKEKMKPFGDVLTPAEIKDMVAYVRSLKK